MTAKQEILKQIDSALALWGEHRAKSKYEDLSDLPDRALLTEVSTVLAATIDRVAPPKSPYREAMNHILPNKVGALRALRRDYDAGYLATVQDLVRAEVFVDFFEMAEHLLQQGYKDPSAVIIGSVLEEHLRVLCQARAIPTVVVGKH